MVKNGILGTANCVNITIFDSHVQSELWGVKSLILFLCSCNSGTPSDSHSIADTTSSKQNVVVTKSVQEIFSHGDSIANWAMGDFYFGKLRSTKEQALPELGGVKFNSVVNLNCSYEFSHSIKDPNWENPETLVKKLYEILNYKYGLPKRLNTIETSNDFLGRMMDMKIVITKRKMYQWSTQWKKIILSTEEKNNKIESVSLEIINCVLEKEHQNEIEKRKLEEKLNAAKKI